MSDKNEENIRLVNAYRAALAAEDKIAARKVATEILRVNKGLIIQFAMRWARPETDADKEDAFQAANMGVLRALKDFDPKLGSFSTHVGNHVRDYVQRFTGKTQSVVRPRSATMPASIARLAAKFRMLNGREPSALDLGVTEQQLTDWSMGTHFVELQNDADASDDEKPRVQLTYAEDESEAEHETRCLQLEGAWKQALEKLSPRNREIADRVLMKGEEVKVVGESYGLTHGRIVQVCKRIETQLRRALNPSAYDPALDPDRKEAQRQRALRRTRTQSTMSSSQHFTAPRCLPTLPVVEDSPAMSLGTALHLAVA